MKITALVLAAVVVSLPGVSATSVEAVTFEGLVQAAQQIFVGEVVDVDSARADVRGNLRIRTRVTFRVDDAVRGPRMVSVLEFLGGTVGDLTQEVDGVPAFVPGERYVVFARDGDHWVNPVVGFTQGLLRVSHDARNGSSLVLTHAGSPLADVAHLGRPGARVSRAISEPLTLTAFLAAVRAEVSRQGR